MPQYLRTTREHPQLKPKHEPTLLASGRDSEMKTSLLGLELDPGAELEEADDTADFCWVPRGLAAVSAVVAVESIAAAGLLV